MQSKCCFLLMLCSFCAGVAQAQPGNTNFNTAKLGISTIGTSQDYGKSTLPVCTPRSVSCSQAFTYTFTGSGSWMVETNWKGNAIPPPTLPAGAVIIIDPVPGGECILNIQQTIANNASIIVKAGKKLKVLTQLVLQH